MTDVVAALIWDGDKFLACQRPAHKALGLLWEFVGGKVEPGETPEEALIRECREELGVTVAPADVFMEVVHDYPDLVVRLILFNAVITEGIPQKLEHRDMRWITSAQIDEYNFCPADKDILKVLKNIENSVQAALYANKDTSYHQFQTKLLPGIDPASVLGVRMPVLRRLSMQYGIDRLGHLPYKYYEENVLHALHINRMTAPTEAISALDAFLPFVDNWAVCDAISPRAFVSRPTELLTAIDRWICSDQPYTVRFGIEMLMKYYLDSHFQPTYLQKVATVRSDHYYVNMMIAWYFATALAKQYSSAISVLENKMLDCWTHSKTIQKACESFRISPDQKKYLRTLKIKRRTNA